MRVLFAILVVAIAGLLWATLAAAQHIRRARRRQRGLPPGPDRGDRTLAKRPAPPPPEPQPGPPLDRLLPHLPLEQHLPLQAH